MQKQTRASFAAATTLAVLGFVTAALAYTGCGTASSGDVTITANFSSINANVFQARCVSCHSGGSPSGDVNLSTYTALMASGVVVAGNPSGSKLYQQVSAGTMPRSGSMLSSQNVSMISEWIQNGAAND